MWVRVTDMANLAFNTLKKTDVIWLPQIPEHWEIVKVRHLFKESTKKGFPHETLLVASQEHGVVSKDAYGKRTVEATKDFHNLKLVEQGDYVISLRSFQGGIELAHQRGIISPAYTVLKETQLIDKRYFKNLFKSPPFISLMTLCVKGIREGQNIDYPTFKNEFLPFPPIEEQKAIAEYLDKKNDEIDRFIRNKEALIGLLEEQKQSVLRKLVASGLNENKELKNSNVKWIGKIPCNWNIMKIKYLGKFTNGYSFDSGDFVDEGIKVIKISNIQPMQLLWEDVSFVKESFYDRYKAYRVTKGDLVFALTRPIIKGGIKVAFIDIEEKLLINQRNAVYKPRNKLYKDWIYFVILNKDFINEFNIKIDHTGQQPNISTNDIGNIYIPLPSIFEQKKLVESIKYSWAKINVAITKSRQEIASIKQYREALITDLVTGKRCIPTTE
jgi:type I restriction enzyme S subunit